ncbi:hypothetical protein KUCAC02_017237 [Chaenocephalus aceratus]|uniref:Uncharacterized protein n=1 Tax=Chaenocephalus aceratus TaxID=36190 RepID=A0ACB9W1J1_CHAAC|nr:hypothetical protein KUCAC02_017237 [Chaenocephalus aceratus]
MRLSTCLTRDNGHRCSLAKCTANKDQMTILARMPVDDKQTVGSPRRASRGVAFTSPPVAPRLSKTGGKAMTPVLCHGLLRNHHPPQPSSPPRQSTLDPSAATSPDARA